MFKFIKRIFKQQDYCLGYSKPPRPLPTKPLTDEDMAAWKKVHKKQRKSINDFQKCKNEFEKGFIERNLRRFKYNIKRTAIQCNIPYNTLVAKIKKYGIIDEA